MTSNAKLANPNMSIGGMTAGQLNQTMIGGQDKDIILPVDKYAQDFFNTIKKKYDDMVKEYDGNRESIVKKQNYLKMESQLIMTRMQKFMSHMLVEAQREMHKNIDNHQKKFKKQIDDIESQLITGKYWEIVHNKKEIKILKRQISQIIEQYKEPEENLYRFAKLNLLRNLLTFLKELMEVIEFNI